MSPLSLLLASVLAVAGPPAKDAALATSVGGTVTLSISGGEAAPLVPFSKVREGDMIEVPEGGVLDLMYFGDGHKEAWKGPVKLAVTIDGGTADGAKAAVTAGDPLVGEALQNVPVILTRAELDKGGHTLVRGDAPPPVELDEEEAAEVEAARKRYEGWERAGDEDILPEMYLASVLISFGLDADALPVLRDAGKRCGECEAPKQLVSWLDKPEN